MTIDRFVDEFRASSDVERRLVVLNRTEPDPVQSMLRGVFEDQPVTVEEAEVPDDDSDVVALVEDGETVATSPLEALEETSCWSIPTSTRPDGTPSPISTCPTC